MTTKLLRIAGGALLALAPALAVADAPTPDKGDIAWMMTATLLVTLMTIPGLALFYGGMVRSKNVLSVLMQVMIVCCLGTVLWVVYGYSLAFTTGNAFIGGFDKLFLSGVDATTLAATFSKGVYIPEYVYIVFQGTFAAITPCPHRRRLRRAHEVRRHPAVRGALADVRLLPDRAHGVVLGRPRCLHRRRDRSGCARPRRLPVPARRLGLRRRHGGAHQRGHRGTGRRPAGRQAHRLRHHAPWRRTTCHW